ncbi:MAG TPA: FCD domain-containing protein, partial [Chloroflexota bacterium]|nr:FCD domain-containing protein [Chloroflexota bacterium]
ELGVSRACMREALQALASLGVIEVRSGRGARVKFMTAESLFDPAGVAGLLDPEELIHLWQVRVAIEVAAVRLAAELVSDEDIARLEAIVRATSDHVEKEDLHGYIESDLAFHRFIIQATSNSIFDQVYKVISRAVRLSVRATGGTPGGMMRGREGHLAVFEAVKARDPERAAGAMRRHLGGPNTYRDALAGLPAARSGLDLVIS